MSWRTVMGWSLLSLIFGGCRTAAGTGAAPAEERELRRLAIYYGWPSGVDGARSVEEAAVKLGQYEVVVLGSGLERPDHGDHEKTRAILECLRGRVQVYGYVPLGAATGLRAAQIEERTRAWKEMGVAGIFFDEAGYDFGNTRSRQNEAFRATHLQGLRVFANAFDPDDLFVDRADSRVNAAGEGTALHGGDSYLYESFGLKLGQPEREEERRKKMAKLASAFRLGVHIFGVTTSVSPSDFDHARWSAVVREARRLGLRGLGWGEPDFGAPDGRLTPRDMAP
jgi:hypothetical protein